MQQAMAFEQNKNDLQTVKGTIKNFLNTMNDSLRLLADNGQDTKELYQIFDMLRYEVLSDERIGKLYYAHKTDDIIKTLNIFNGLLTDLIKQGIEAKGLKSEEELEIEKYEKNIKKLNRLKPDRYDRAGAIKDAIYKTWISLGVIAGIVTGTSIYKAAINGPATLEYSIDSEGHIEEQHHRYPVEEENQKVIISDYYLEEGKTTAIERIYELNIDSNLITSKEELDQIDLSLFTPVDVRIVNNENGVSGHYRTYNVLRQEEGNIVHYDEMALSDKIIAGAVCTTLGLVVDIIIGLLPATIQMTEEALFDFCFVKYIMSLVKYKSALKKELNELNTSKDKKAEYEKLVNTICNRIDRTIVDLTERLAFLAEYKAYKNAKANEQEYKEAIEENKKANVEAYDNISNLIATLTTCLSNLDDDEFRSNMLHSVSISDKVLFENKDDHLIIRPLFVPLLPFLDLRLISFKNVDIRYIDFSETNATLNLRDVYNMDASYATFSDDNVPDWASYDDVILIGTKLKENPDTMIGLKNAIVNEETSIKL